MNEKKKMFTAEEMELIKNYQREQSKKYRDSHKEEIRNSQLRYFLKKATEEKIKLDAE